MRNYRFLNKIEPLGKTYILNTTAILTMILVNYKNDCTKIKKLIREYELGSSLSKSFDEILKKNPTMEAERAHISASIRTFFENLIISLAGRISTHKDTPIKRLENGGLLGKYLKYLLDEKVISEEELGLIRKFRVFQSKTGGNHSLKTTNEEYRLTAILTLELTLILLQRARSILPDKSESRFVPAISKFQFENLLKNTTSRRHKIAFLLSFGSGLKISEVLSAKLEDFDIERGILKVKMKGDGGRDVPLDKRIQEEHIKEYIPISRSVRALQKAFLASAKGADMSADFNFSSLRKGFAYYLKDNKNWEEIAKLMGLKMSHAGVFIKDLELDDDSEAII